MAPIRIQIINETRTGVSVCSSHLGIEVQEGSSEQEVNVGKNAEKCEQKNDRN